MLPHAAPARLATPAHRLRSLLLTGESTTPQKKRRLPGAADKSKNVLLGGILQENFFIRVQQIEGGDGADVVENVAAYQVVMVVSANPGARILAGKLQPFGHFLVYINIDHCQPPLFDGLLHVRQRPDAFHDVVAGRAAGVAEKQHGKIGLDAVQRADTPFQVGKREIRRRGADAVQRTHLDGIIVRRLTQGRCGPRTHPREVEVLVADRGVRVV